MKTLTEFSKTTFQRAFHLRSEMISSGSSEASIRDRINREFSLSQPKSEWLWNALTHVEEVWMEDLKRVVIAVLDNGNWAPYYSVDAGDFFILYEPLRPVEAPYFPDERLPADDDVRRKLATDEWLRLWAEKTGGRVPKWITPK